MIEIYGGPHDGAVLRRRPTRGATIFLTPEGAYRLKPKPGDEALIEYGVCGGCGARLGSERPRRFAPLWMPVDPCQLCGATTKEEKHEHHD